MKDRSEKYVLCVAFFAFTVFQHFFITGKVTLDLISNIVVFLSIVFGFFATSLAIFATSRYSGVLYGIEDGFNGDTLLHTLIRKYKRGLYVALSSIMYLLFLTVYMNGNDFTLFSDIYVAPFLAVVIVNMYFSISLVSIVSSFVLQEAKRK